MYYRTGIRLAQFYAGEATTMIDVGAPWPYVTAFSWIANKTMLNDRFPEGSTAPPDVTLVQADFFNFEVPAHIGKYDLVLCNQVLEHVDDPAAFAKKLLEIGKVVIASVPHNWAPLTHLKNQEAGHKTDYIKPKTLVEW